MQIFEATAEGGHEQVLFAMDADSGLRAIIAIHSTALGPALGGTRFYAYASEEDALADALRLSRAMTRKNAAAGLDLGGGKGVILGDPRREKGERLLRAYGRAIDSLGGRYITAEDVGTRQADMEMIARETAFVTGTGQDAGGSGDPSPATARGLLAAMRGVARFLWGGAPELAGRHVAIQGVGKVGGGLARLLAEAGARLTIADVNEEALRAVAAELGAEVAGAGAIHATACDLFAPCALGGSLTAQTVPELRCAAVVGSANNQLADDAIAVDLTEREVLLRPRLHRERRRCREHLRGSGPGVPRRAGRSPRGPARGDHAGPPRAEPCARGHAARGGHRSGRASHQIGRRASSPGAQPRPHGKADLNLGN